MTASIVAILDDLTTVLIMKVAHNVTLACLSSQVIQAFEINAILTDVDAVFKEAGEQLSFVRGLAR